MPGCERDCTTKCDFDVDVDIFTRPNARVTKGRRCEVDFLVDLDVELKKPHCRVTQARTKEKKDDCTSGCLFNIALEFEIEADVVCDPCPKQRCPVKVEVDTKHFAKCKLRKDCEEKSSSKSRSHSKSKSYHSDCDVCKKQRSGRRH